MAAFDPTKPFTVISGPEDSIPLEAPSSKGVPVTYYSQGAAVGGTDESQDKWTNRGYTSTGQNLGPGVAAVNDKVYPLGTVFRDEDTGDVFVAADRHGNDDPNVIDIYETPDTYRSRKEQRNLSVIGKLDQVPKTHEGIAAAILPFRAEDSINGGVNNTAVEFDPTKPFTVISNGTALAFDSSKPFEVISEGDSGELPYASPGMADSLGLKRWRDPHYGEEVRRAEPAFREFGDGAKLPQEKAQSWWKNWMNSVARGATSEGYMMASEGLHRAVGEQLRNPSGAEPWNRRIADHEQALKNLNDAQAERGFAMPDDVQRRAGIQQEIENARAEIAKFSTPGTAEFTSVDPSFETSRKAIADYLTRTADIAGEQREDVRKFFNVDGDFEKSLGGQILQGVGQLATVPAYAVPGAGPTMTFGQLYQEARDDYDQTAGYTGPLAQRLFAGEKLTPEEMEQMKREHEAKAHRAAMEYVAGAMPLEVLTDKLMIGKALKAVKGKITVGQLAKTFGALGASGGVSEGSQQAWLNTIAKQLEGYDPSRKIDDQVVESVLVGGLVSGLGGTVAQTMAPRKVEAPGQPASEQRPADTANASRQTVAIERPTKETPIGERPAPAAGEPAPAPPPASTPNVASVPTMITRKMEAELLARGKTQAEINAMTPAQAWEFLNQKADAGEAVKESLTPEQEAPAATPSPELDEDSELASLTEQEIADLRGDTAPDELSQLEAELSEESEFAPEEEMEPEAPVTPADPKLERIRQALSEEQPATASDRDFDEAMRRFMSGEDTALPKSPNNLPPNFLRKLRGEIASKQAGEINETVLRDIAEFGRSIYQKGMDFAKWVAEMVRQLGEKVRPFLQETWDQITSPRRPIAREMGSIGSKVPKFMQTKANTAEASEITQPLNQPPAPRVDIYERARRKLAEVSEQVHQQAEGLRTVGTDTSQFDRQAEARLLRIEQEKETALARLDEQEKAEIAEMGEENLVKFTDRLDAAKSPEARAVLRRDAKAMAKAHADGVRAEYAERRKRVTQRAADRSRAVIQRQKLRTTAKDEAALRRAEILGSLAKLEAVMSVMPPDVRGRVGGARTMASMTTDAARMEYLKERVRRLADELEKMMAKIYDRRLQKLFNRAKPARDKAGKMTKGKAGADTHALFARLKQGMELSQSEADARVSALDAEIQKGEMSFEEEARAILEMNLLPLVADWANKGSAARAEALEELDRVFERGFAQFQMQKFLEREERKERRAALKSDTGKSGDLPERQARLAHDMGIAGTVRKWIINLSSFEQVARYIFGDQSAEARRLVDMERHASNTKEDALFRTMDGIDMLFRRLARGGELAGQKLQWRMSQPSMTAKGVKLSEMEAITATLMWRQEDGRRHMQGQMDPTGMPSGAWHYDQAFVDEIESKLSPEAKAVRDWIAAQYAAEYATLNPVYRQMNGIDMPHHENYSPLTVKPQQAQGGQTIDPVTGNSMSSGSTTPPALRRRGGAISEPEFRDALQTFIAHAKQIEHWKAYAPFSREARALLGNREVRNSAEAKSGEEATKTLSSWLDFFEQGGTRDAGTHLEISQGLQRATGRATAMSLVGRAVTIMIQSTQLGAALAEMPTGAYLRRISGLLTGQMGWRAAIESPYIQRRLAQMPVVVRQALEGLAASKPGAIKHAAQKLGQLIGGADALFTAGTYAMVYDWQLSQGRKQGLTGTELETFAREAAERITDRVAQPTRAGARSILENTATGWWSKMIWAFASEARKNLGLLAYNARRGEKGQGWRTAAFVFILNGLVATLIRSAWRDMRDEDDDEVWDAKHWNPAKILRAVATEPLYGIPVVGDLLQGAILKLFGDYVPEGNLINIPSRTISAVKRLPETLAGRQDAEGVVKDAQAILAAVGLTNDTIAGAASLSNVAADMVTSAKNFAGDSAARTVTRAGKRFAESQGRKYSGLGDQRADLFSALVEGDRAEVREIFRQKVEGKTGAARQMVVESMRDSVQGLSPLRMAAGSAERIPAFKAWAARNAPTELREIERMEARYKATAAGAIFR